MKLVIPVVALLAVAARSGCGDGGDSFDPCAGRICGEACSTCPPNVNCSPPASPMACDPAGRCVTEVAGMCGENAACAGKACGAECTIDPPCRSATPPCTMPSAAGICTAAGQCVPLGLPVPACPPVADCSGKACGEACNPCAPVACGSPVAYACDRSGFCIPTTPWLCYDPCAGKLCGDACRVCPPDAPDCAETAVVKACDATGRCVARTPGLVCP